MAQLTGNNWRKQIQIIFSIISICDELLGRNYATLLIATEMWLVFKRATSWKSKVGKQCCEILATRLFYGNNCSSANPKLFESGAILLNINYYMSTAIKT